MHWSPLRIFLRARETAYCTYSSGLPRRRPLFTLQNGLELVRTSREASRIIVQLEIPCRVFAGASWAYLDHLLQFPKSDNPPLDSQGFWVKFRKRRSS